MTTPKVNTIKRGGARFYVEPESGVKVPGVTSVVGMLPKEFLQFWNAKMVAEEAVNNLGTLVSMVTGPSGKAGGVDWLKGAARRFTAQAAEVGTAAHDLFEREARGETIGRVHPDLEPYLAHFRDFLDVAQPEYHFLEETVWNETHSYAGSFDAFATIQGERVWLDNKTTRSGIHEEVGIQLAAYRYAEHIIRPDGGRIPQPQADGGAVLHIRPEGWSLVPVRCDEALFDMFLHLRQVFEWEKTLKSTVKGRAVFSGPAEGAVVETGPKRRTPRARSAA